MSGSEYNASTSGNATNTSTASSSGTSAATNGGVNSPQAVQAANLSVIQAAQQHGLDFLAIMQANAQQQMQFQLGLALSSIHNSAIAAQTHAINFAVPNALSAVGIKQCKFVDGRTGIPCPRTRFWNNLLYCKDHGKYERHLKPNRRSHRDEPYPSRDARRDRRRQPSDQFIKEEVDVDLNDRRRPSRVKFDDDLDQYDISSIDSQRKQSRERRPPVIDDIDLPEDDPSDDESITDDASDDDDVIVIRKPRRRHEDENQRENNKDQAETPKE
jgi:hypothetical protein